jgi:hypothetical protein
MLPQMRRSQSTAPQVHPRPPPVMVPVDFDLVVRLRREAARRDLPLSGLIHELLTVIAEDELTTAVLDDNVG